MSQAITVNITGDKELDALLAGFEKKTRNKITRKAVKLAAAPVLATAKARVPVETGALKKSLRIRAMKRSRKNPHLIGASVVTGEAFFKGDQYYGAFVEFGWRLGKRTSNEKAGGRRRKRRRGFLKTLVEAINRNRRSVRAKPYMRPAYDENKGRVRSIFQTAVAQIIDEVARNR